MPGRFDPVVTGFKTITKQNNLSIPAPQILTPAPQVLNPIVENRNTCINTESNKLSFQSMFSGAIFNNCTFNFVSSSSDQQQPPTKPIKRRHLLYDSDKG